MRVTSHEYKDQPGMLVVELRDDVEAEYGSQVAPGIHLHYARAEEGRRIPVFIEIEVWNDGVHFERRRDGQVEDLETTRVRALLSAIASVEDSFEEVRDAIGGVRGESGYPKTKK